MNDIGLLAQVLNCRIGALPTTYLGVPLDARNKDYKVWNPVVQRVEKRLEGGTKDICPKAGRKCFLRAHYRAFSRITSPCFMLQLWLLKLEKIREIRYGMRQVGQRNFTWCSGRLSHLLKNGDVLELKI